MKEQTLKELCTTCGVSRRAVQGYEKHGLVHPSGKNDRGYLLYDEHAQGKVRYIKSLQDYGFSLKEIVDFLQADTDVQRILLQEKLMQLVCRRDEIERWINELRDMVKIMDE